MLTNKKKTVVLLQGTFHPSFFNFLKKRRIKEAFILEGRPSLQAARLNSKALLKVKIKPILIADNFAGLLFYKGFVKEVWLAYQLAGKDGALCDIGALILAVLGKRHKVSVHLYLASQETKLSAKQSNVFYFQGKRVAAKGVRSFTPSLEWVPSKYITEVCK